MKEKSKNDPLEVLAFESLNSIITQINSMAKRGILESHPLDHPGVVKIALSQSATDALQASGQDCLIIATMADSTAPEHAQGRMILHCLPCAKEALDGAYRVASGKARPVKVKLLPIS